MQEMLNWIKINFPTIGWSLLILSIFVEITPIKICPWSSLLKWIGKKITNNACDKIDGLITKVNNLESNIDSNEKDRIRWEILEFANSCRNERKHSRDEFQHIVDLNDKYKCLLKKTEDTNGVFDIEFKYIQDLYAERLAKNDFL